MVQHTFGGELAHEASILEMAKAIPKKKQDPIKNINLFSILGMEHKEVSAHSAFLYYIFKQFNKEDKSIDDINLRLLYNMLKEKNPDVQYPNTPKYIHLYKEVSFAYGRLDFLIVYSDDSGEKEDAIIIELKIWAGEQSHQIERYKFYLEDNGYSVKNIFFLTPLRRESITGDSINITLKDDIIPVLKKISDYRSKNIPYITIIKQYIDVITNITGEKEMSDNNVIKSPEDIIALDNLLAYRTEALTKMLSSFLGNVKNKFENKLKQTYPTAFDSCSMSFLDCQDNEDYLSSYYVNGRSCYPAIILKLKKDWLKPDIISQLDNCNASKEYYPCFYIEIENTLYAGFSMKCGDEKPEYYDISPVQQLLKDTYKTENTSKWWLDWNWVKVNGNKIDFKYYDDPNQGVFLLMNGNGFVVNEEIIDQIVDNCMLIFENLLIKFFEVEKLKDVI